MMLFWLFAFALGQSISATLSIQTIPLLNIKWQVLVSFVGIGVLLLSLNLRFVFITLVLILGVFWGVLHFGHAAGSVSGAHAKIISRDSFGYKQGPSLVGTADGKLYLVFSKQKVGGEGVIRCSRKADSKRDICTMKSHDASGVVTSHWLNNSISRITAWSSKRIDSLPEVGRRWMKVLLLGDTSQLGQEELDSFRHSGLFHLLVISGFHIGLLGELAMAFIRKLICLPYALRLINSKHAIVAETFGKVFTAMAVLIFAMSVGMNAASQRASLVFSGVYLMGSMQPNLSKAKVLASVAVLQSLLFPISFLSAGNIMSWVGFLLFMSFRTTGLVLIFKSQAIIFFSSVILFEQWAPLGFILNPIFGDFFNAAVILAVVGYIFGRNCDYCLELLELCLGSFSVFLVRITELLPMHHWLNQRLDGTSLTVKIACGLILLYFFMSFSNSASNDKLTIHK